MKQTRNTRSRSGQPRLEPPLRPAWLRPGEVGHHTLTCAALETSAALRELGARLRPRACHNAPLELSRHSVSRIVAGVVLRLNVVFAGLTGVLRTASVDEVQSVPVHASDDSDENAMSGADSADDSDDLSVRRRRL